MCLYPSPPTVCAPFLPQVCAHLLPPHPYAQTRSHCCPRWEPKRPHYCICHVCAPLFPHSPLPKVFSTVGPGGNPSDRLLASRMWRPHVALQCCFVNACVLSKLTNDSLNAALCKATQPPTYSIARLLRQRKMQGDCHLVGRHPVLGSGLGLSCLLGLR